MNELRSLIMKVASRCNLNCSYCYMYNLADKTFRQQPALMSPATVRATFDWIEKQLKHSKLPGFHVSLHGGEPLLATPQLIEFIADERERVQTRVQTPISLSLLTNGILLNEQWVEIFVRRKIKFGFSLDGPADYHDRFRVTHKGEATHAEVEQKLRWVLQHPTARSCFSSVLCVVHPSMDGSRLLRYFYDLDLPGVDFLLPDQNWIHGSSEYPTPSAIPTYGKVLGDAYLEWRDLDEPRFHVRKFGLFVRATLGRVPRLDSVGTGPISVFTVETSGEVEPVDSLKICGNGFTKSGINIRDTTPQAVREIPLIAYGLAKGSNLPNVCHGCRNLSLCGGGYLPHRYDGSSFAKPTVYCSDMMYLSDLIRLDTLTLLAAAQKSTKSAASGRQVLNLRDCLRLLETLGAQNEAHSGSNLLHHLIGTASILAGDGMPLDVIKAGLFHSVYGTASFMPEKSVAREELQTLIGPDAEELVFLYSQSTANDLSRRIKSDRTEQANLRDKVLTALLHIKRANAAEQARRTNDPRALEDLARYDDLISSYLVANTVADVNESTITTQEQMAT